MEEVIAIGSTGLYGLLTHPATPSSAPAIVLFNAGLVHRVGPSRVNVRMARAFAASGRTAFRFDLPGIGDAIGPARLSWLQAASAGLDALQAYIGTAHFVVGGLCSAADLAWQLALADKRVCGLIALDGFARRSFWFRLGELALLWRRPWRQWPDMVRRRLHKDEMESAEPSVDELRDWPALGEECAQAAALAARKVEMFALYTGGAAPYFLDRRQFAATFGALARGPRAHLEFWPECDHAFYSARDRNRLVAGVCAWLDEHCVA
jgi:hypothetical protein